MKTWHLTLTRATHAPQVTFNSSGGGSVTLSRGKVTVTNVDLGTTLQSNLIRVLRVEDSTEDNKSTSRVDAVVKRINPAPKPPPVVEVKPPIVEVQPPAPVVEVQPPAPVVEAQPEVKVATESPKAKKKPVARKKRAPVRKKSK